MTATEYTVPAAMSLMLIKQQKKKKESLTALKLMASVALVRIHLSSSDTVKTMQILHLISLLKFCISYLNTIVRLTYLKSTVNSICIYVLFYAFVICFFVPT